MSADASTLHRLLPAVRLCHMTVRAAICLRDWWRCDIAALVIRDLSSHTSDLHVDIRLYDSQILIRGCSFWLTYLTFNPQSGKNIRLVPLTELQRWWVSGEGWLRSSKATPAVPAGPILLPWAGRCTGWGGWSELLSASNMVSHSQQEQRTPLHPNHVPLIPSFCNLYNVTCQSSCDHWLCHCYAQIPQVKSIRTRTYEWTAVSLLY